MTAASMFAASTPKRDITSVAISAAMPKSEPVALANSTVLRVAPCKISSIASPLRASISMASAASVVVTFSCGSSDRSVIKFLNGCISSIVLPVTEAMFASCCSRLAAPLTPVAMAAPTPATAAPSAAIAPTTPTEIVFCKRPNVVSAPPAFRSSLARSSVTSLIVAEALLRALIRMSSVAILCLLKSGDRWPTAAFDVAPSCAFSRPSRQSPLPGESHLGLARESG